MSRTEVDREQLLAALAHLRSGDHARRVEALSA